VVAHLEEIHLFLLEVLLSYQVLVAAEAALKEHLIFKLQVYLEELEVDLALEDM
jgi:hypothetical protein